MNLLTIAMLVALSLSTFAKDVVLAESAEGSAIATNLKFNCEAVGDHTYLIVDASELKSSNRTNVKRFSFETTWPLGLDYCNKKYKDRIIANIQKGHIASLIRQKFIKSLVLITSDTCMQTLTEQAELRLDLEPNNSIWFEGTAAFALPNAPATKCQ